MEQEDFATISQEIKEWEMSINHSLEKCQIDIDIVEKASIQCSAETSSEKIVKTLQESITKYPEEFKCVENSAFTMKEITLLSKDGGYGKITTEQKKFKRPGKLKFQCDECPVKYNWKVNLLVHKTNKHSFNRKCDECEFHTTTSKRMQDHIKRIHSKEKYICDECEFVTFQEFVFKKHQCKRHNTLNQDEDISCKFCKFSFLTTGNRKLAAKHMKSEHPKERLFKCDECDYGSNWRNNIRMHKDGKHRTSKLVCTKCKYASFWMPAFLYHKRTVHGIFKYKSNSREAPKPCQTKLCDLCGFQTNNDKTMKINNHQRGCMASKIVGTPAQIDDVRSEIDLYKKIPCNARSAKQKRRLQKLQQQLCSLKNRLMTLPFQKSERRGRKKKNPSVRSVGVKDTEESDAAKILSVVEKHQADMSWKDETAKSVSEVSFGIDQSSMDVMSEITNEVETQPLGVQESMRTIIQGEKVSNVSECEFENTSMQAIVEGVLMIQTVEGKVSMTIIADKGVPIKPSIDKGVLLKQNIDNVVSTTKTIEQEVLIPQTHDGEGTILQQEKVLNLSESIEMNTEKTTCDEKVLIKQTIEEGVSKSQPLEEEVSITQTVKEQVSMPQTDEEDVPMTQTVEDEVEILQGLEEGVSIQIAVEEGVLVKQTSNLKTLLIEHDRETDKNKCNLSSYDTEEIYGSIELENYNYFKILLGIK